MNATQENLSYSSAEAITDAIADAITVNTVATQQEHQPDAPVKITEEATAPHTFPEAYNSYLEIREQVERFESVADSDQSVAITLPDYPFFTETRLLSIMIRQSGTVSIIGEAKGGKMVSIRDQIQSLSYALSLMSRPSRAESTQQIEVGYVTSV